MIPTINKFLFYTATDNQLVQVIGETQDKYLDSSISVEENQLFKKKQRVLFDLVDLSFQLDEYGSANWFIEDTYKRFDIENLTEYLISLHKSDMVEYINSLLSFHNENIERFNYMKTNPDDFGEKLEELDEDIYQGVSGKGDFEDCIYAAACDIRCYPDKYCRDENGQKINPNYTGFISYKKMDGNLLAEYNIKDGKSNGLCLDYNVHSQEKEKLSFYHKGKLLEVLKEWDSKGNLKYERTHDKEIKYKNGNLYLVKNFKNDLQTCYYENGKKKYEASNLDYLGYSRPKIIKKWDEKGNLINSN